MPSRYAFANPFRRNHCVVVAFTHLANRDDRFALALAEQARTRDSIDSTAPSWGMPYGTKKPLLNGTGGAWTRGARDLAQWAELAGVTVGERTLYPHGDGPTLLKFGRAHPTGRWLVLVYGHAVALIDGQYYGHYRPRTRVEMFVEVFGSTMPPVSAPVMPLPVSSETITQLIRAGLKAGFTTQQILVTVRLAHPTCRTNGKVIAQYRYNMRRAGELV